MDHRLTVQSEPTPGVESGVRQTPRFHNFQLSKEDTQLLEQLSEPHRRILTTPGNYAEIGTELNLPPGTVRSRIHRARQTLARLRQLKQAGGRESS